MTFNMYLNHDSFLHRVNPTLKYIILIIWFITIPLVSLRVNLMQILIIQLFILLGKIPYIYFQRKFKYLIPLLVITYLVLLVYPILAPIFAVSLLVRLYVMFGAVLIVNSTTSLLELVTLFKFFVKKGFKQEQVNDILMIFLLVINFLPLLANEIFNINQSLYSRNITIKTSGMNFLKIAMNAIIVRLDNLIDELELIFYCRNITVNNVNNVHFDTKIRADDYIFIIICIVCMIGMIII